MVKKVEPNFARYFLATSACRCNGEMLGCGKDVSIAKERKQRRLLGSSAAERVVKSLIFFFSIGRFESRL